MLHLVSTVESDSKVTVETTSTTREFQVRLEGVSPNLVTVKAKEVVKETFSSDLEVAESREVRGQVKLTPGFTKNTKRVPFRLRQCTPYLVRDSFFEFIKSKPISGLPWGRSFGGEHLVGSADVLDFEPTVRNVVWLNVNQGDLMVFDCKGNPIATPLVFDGVGAPLNPDFTDCRYDLPRLLEYLKGHPWVINKSDLAITDNSLYPSLNDCYDEDSYVFPAHIKVVILPDQKSFAAIYKEVEQSSHYCKEFRRRICFWPSKHRERKDWLGVGQFVIKGG